MRSAVHLDDDELVNSALDYESIADRPTTFSTFQSAIAAINCGSIQDTVNLKVANPPKRKVPKACVPCYTTKTSCDGERPCQRCRNMGRVQNCIDRVPGEGRGKRAGQQPPVVVTATAMTTSTATTAPTVIQPTEKDALNQRSPFCMFSSVKVCRVPPVSANSHIPTLFVNMTRGPYKYLQFYINEAYSGLFGYTIEQILFGIKHQGTAFITNVFDGDEEKLKFANTVKYLMQGNPFAAIQLECQNKFGGKFSAVVECHLEEAEDFLVEEAIQRGGSVKSMTHSTAAAATPTAGTSLELGQPASGSSGTGAGADASAGAGTGAGTGAGEDVFDFVFGYACNMSFYFILIPPE